MGYYEGSESLEGKKPSARFELLEGVGSEFRSKEELICWPPAFHGEREGKTKVLILSCPQWVFAEAHKALFIPPSRVSRPSQCQTPVILLPS